jgi:hypothetical protein
MAETPSTKDGDEGCMPSTAGETRTMKMKRGLGSAPTSEREGAKPESQSVSQSQRQLRAL